MLFKNLHSQFTSTIHSFILIQTNTNQSFVSHFFVCLFGFIIQLNNHNNNVSNDHEEEEDSICFVDGVVLVVLFDV